MSQKESSANGRSANLQAGRPAASLLAEHLPAVAAAAAGRQRQIIHIENQYSPSFQEVVIRISHHRSEYNLN